MNEGLFEQMMLVVENADQRRSDFKHATGLPGLREDDRFVSGARVVKEASRRIELSKEDARE